ncbi:MAG: metallophosphoesterase [Planctomycetota bacterium]|nr:metallophosphoesterase [Planctomycetota bacterium]
MNEPTIDFTDPRHMVDLFDEAARLLLASPHRQGCVVRLPARGHLLATGDLHDNIFNLAKILKLARLEASTDRHVILHELIHGENLINGKDFSHRMLGRVAELVLKYPVQVHPLLANHELSQLTGRGVSKGGGNSVALFVDALEYVFDVDAGEVGEAIGRFIRAMPLALTSESGVLCAHSLPTARAVDAGKFDPEILSRDLVNEDYHYPDGNAYLMVWGRTHGKALYEKLAKAWGVKLFILGHQHVETGIEIKSVAPGHAPGHAPGGESGVDVIVLNSDHEYAMTLPIDLANPPHAEEALMMAMPLASVG